MFDASDDHDLLLNQLADEFATRRRAGERPRLEDYCERHPKLASDIRSLFPAMVELERVKADAGPELAVEVADAPPITELGDFRLLREVGRGGMGVVYEAEQVSLGRRVAIKLLPASVFQDPAKRRRFEREAKAAAKLHHTNIVPVHGFGEHDGTPYYVMQFIPGLGLDVVIDELGLLPTSGRTLDPHRPPSDDRAALSITLARSLVGAAAAEADNEAATLTVAGSATPNPPSLSRADRSSSAVLSTSGVHLPGQSGSVEGAAAGKKTNYWASVARIGVQVAGALAYAHKAGVLHRDIKPANLLLDLDGIVWVTDFGLAKADDSDDLTHTGDVLGTLRYMSPETFEGKSDARSDIYALGLTLFELVALRPAYEERDRNKLIKQVTTGDPPRLRKLRKDAPRDLVTIVEKAIDKEPARRYQSAGVLADDLQRFLDGRPITARPVGHLERAVKWVKRNPVVTGAALAVLLALSLGTTVSYLKYHDAEEQKSIAEAREQQALQEAEKAKKARDFLVSIFQISERDVQGGNITARQILTDAEKRIQVEFADQPELRGELMAAIGTVKRGLGRRVPQAMILEARGTVELQSATGSKKAAAPQTLVNLDDRLTLSADGKVLLVFLADFHKERIKAGRSVTIDWKNCEPSDGILERDDSILMTFVRLPKGTFYMGGGGVKVGKKTEIKDDFEIAVHDVTQGQWEAIMGNNPSQCSRQHGAGNDISDEELKLFPVENVSWDDGQAFIKKLNERERGKGYLYRLPTEAEWEYACRNGATTEEECSYQFYFAQPTNDLSSDQANFNGEYPFGKAAKGKYMGRPTRVGAYPPNKLGLCDMHGNVWQWCDPVGGGLVKANRGGCWDLYGNTCTAAFRITNAPSRRYFNHGFRLARGPDSADHVHRP